MKNKNGFAGIDTAWRPKFLRRHTLGLAGALFATLFISTAFTAHAQRLVVGLLPLFDVLPYYVAAEKGYFDHPGVDIQAVSVGSALERDQLLQAGRIDGVVNEMIAVANFNRRKPMVQIVAIARESRPNNPLFRLIASPGSPIQTAADMADIPIAVSRHTIIEYVTERILTDQGLDRSQIAVQSVPVIPERFQLLMHGRLEAATLPDPLAKSAIVSGAHEILNDEAYPFYSASVLTFSLPAITGKRAALDIFMKGWHRAVKDINAAPETYKSLLLKHVRVPPNVRDNCPIPLFPDAKAPTAEQWQDVIQWMMDKKLIDQPVDYAQSISTEFLATP